MLTLTERIREAETRRKRDLRYLRPAEPVPFRPQWLKRLTPRDETFLVLSDGCGPDGRAA